tara:strand:+ start:824 stop:1303 length:480 start_codon:yes stop_codon:yes gene_type:complete
MLNHTTLKECASNITMMRVGIIASIADIQERQLRRMYQSDPLLVEAIMKGFAKKISSQDDTVILASRTPEGVEDFLLEQGINKELLADSLGLTERRLMLFCHRMPKAFGFVVLGYMASLNDETPTRQIEETLSIEPELEFEPELGTDTFTSPFLLNKSI